MEVETYPADKRGI